MEQPTKLLVTVDIIIFTIQNESLKVLLVKRKYDPFKDFWAIPGGFVQPNESLEDAAKRELVEETGVKDIYLEQLYTFGNPARDPRGRVISTAYFALINSKNQTLRASTDVVEAQWYTVNKIPKLAFDHKSILDYSLKRLQWKLEYTTVAFQLLPKKFTLTQLQKIYEIIINKPFDKRNFRKKIHSLDVIEETGEITEGVSHRPAKLYQCKRKIGEIIELI